MLKYLLVAALVTYVYRNFILGPPEQGSIHDQFKSKNDGNIKQQPKEDDYTDYEEIK